MPAQHRDGVGGVGGPGGQQADQRSLHSTHAHILAGNLNPPRSMSPVSSMSGDELSHGGRRSQRRRPLLDKQVSVLKQTKYNRCIESFLKVSVDLFYVATF